MKCSNFLQKAIRLSQFRNLKLNHVILYISVFPVCTRSTLYFPQYVFDGSTPEQNSVVNLMQLAKLFLDHLILCCVKQAGEKVDIFRMIRSKDTDETDFNRLFFIY